MQADWINAHSWGENIPAPMSPAEMSQFQARLNAICGTEADGTPHLRLVWGQDLNPQSVHCDALFDREAYWVPRHHWTTKYEPKANPQTGLIKLEPHYIGVPRYFILAYVPPEHTPDSERVARYEDGHMLEPEMNKVQWVDFMEVFQHVKRQPSGDYGCCLELAERGLNCFGHFRLPDEQDLRYVERCYTQWQRLAQRIDPNKPYNKADHAAKWRAIMGEKAREKAKASEERQREFVDFFQGSLATSVVVPTDLNF